MGFISTLIALILSFLTAEFLRAGFFTKEWQYRYSEEHKVLEPWQKAIILMAGFILVFPFINSTLVTYSEILFGIFGWYQLSLLFFLLPFTYLWIMRRTLNLEWDWYDSIPLGIIVLDLIITFIIWWF